MSFLVDCPNLALNFPKFSLNYPLPPWLVSIRFPVQFSIIINYIILCSNSRSVLFEKKNTIYCGIFVSIYLFSLHSFCSIDCYSTHVPPWYLKTQVWANNRSWRDVWKTKSSGWNMWCSATVEYRTVPLEYPRSDNNVKGI